MFYYISANEFKCPIFPDAINVSLHQYEGCKPKVICEIHDPYNSNGLLWFSQCGYSNLSFWLYLIIRSVADMFLAAAVTLLATAVVIATRETSTGTYIQHLFLCLLMFIKFCYKQIICYRTRRCWEAICPRSIGFRNFCSNNWCVWWWNLSIRHDMFYNSHGTCCCYFIVWWVSSWIFRNDAACKNFSKGSFFQRQNSRNFCGKKWRHQLEILHVSYWCRHFYCEFHHWESPWTTPDHSAKNNVKNGIKTKVFLSSFFIILLVQ